MFSYFGYGSNINLISLKAKGVIPIHSQKATLRGWRLVFNVEHWFRHEGGMGNIVPSTSAQDQVEGVVHQCLDAHLPSMDSMESYGVAYDRVEIELDTESGPLKAWAYVGLPAYLNDTCLPTRRYLNIILNGAKAAGLSDAYVSNLSRHPLLPELEYPDFVAPKGDFPIYTAESLTSYPQLTALDGAVFDMSQAREKLKVIADLFGGKDMTLFILKRHDTSTGLETLRDVQDGTISPAGKKYLNAYLHAYFEEFKYAGRFSYSD